MRIYSDHITEADVLRAFADARDIYGCDIYVEESWTWKPRHHKYGVMAYGASVNGRRATNNGHGLRAASWEDWGYVIARLYSMDEHARIGHYSHEADFVRQVRVYQPRGSSLAFLAALGNINEYGGYDDTHL